MNYTSGSSSGSDRFFRLRNARLHRIRTSRPAIPPINGARPVSSISPTAISGTEVASSLLSSSFKFGSEGWMVTLGLRLVVGTRVIGMVVLGVKLGLREEDFAVGEGVDSSWVNTVGGKVGDTVGLPVAVPWGVVVGVADGMALVGEPFFLVLGFLVLSFDLLDDGSVSCVLSEELLKFRFFFFDPFFDDLTFFSS